MNLNVVRRDVNLNMTPKESVASKTLYLDCVFCFHMYLRLSGITNSEHDVGGCSLLYNLVTLVGFTITIAKGT